MDELIRIIATACSSAVGVVVSTLIAIIQKIKKDNVKKSDTMYERMLEDVETAETMYKPIEEKGIDCSVMKKSYVMSDLQIYANSKGIKYNADLWDKEVEHIIDFSKRVNAQVETQSTEKGKVIL